MIQRILEWIPIIGIYFIWSKNGFLNTPTNDTVLWYIVLFLNGIWQGTIVGNILIYLLKTYP